MEYPNPNLKQILLCENNLFTGLFLLPEGAVIEGGVTPVRDQADGVPRFISKKHLKQFLLNKISRRMEIATGAAQPIVGRDRESVVIYQVRHS